MCQKVKFWCTLLSFWIVLISISDKRISGLPESLFFKILRLRGIPKAYFSRFQGYGTPRKLVFQDFKASGLPETLFSRISASLTCPHDRQRTFPNVSSDNNTPNRCFHRYLGEPRAAH